MIPEGLVATEDGHGWLILRRPGGSMLARGSDLGQALALLAELPEGEVSTAQPAPVCAACGKTDGNCLFCPGR